MKTTLVSNMRMYTAKRLRKMTEPEAISCHGKKVAVIVPLRIVPALAGNHTRVQGGVMAKFRKRPIVVEALQLTQANWAEMQVFADVGPRDSQAHRLQGSTKILMTMLTPNGMVMAHEGDWIIKDIEGGVYPCKQSVFYATYDPVDEKGNAVTGWDVTLS